MIRAILNAAHDYNAEGAAWCAVIYNGSSKADIRTGYIPTPKGMENDLAREQAIHAAANEVTREFGRADTKLVTNRKSAAKGEVKYVKKDNDYGPAHKHAHNHLKATKKAIKQKEWANRKALSKGRTQITQVREALLAGERLTRFDAHKLGCLDLSPRIAELLKEDLPIKRGWVQRNGRRVREYWIDPPSKGSGSSSPAQSTAA